MFSRLWMLELVELTKRVCVQNYYHTSFQERVNLYCSTPPVPDDLHTSSSISEISTVYYKGVSMDQCHIRMFYRAVAWTYDVTYICAIGLREFSVTNVENPSIMLLFVLSLTPKQRVVCWRTSKEFENLSRKSIFKELTIKIVSCCH